MRRPPQVACWRCVSQSRAHTSRFVHVTHAPSHVHLCVSDAVWWHYRFQNARGVCLPSDATTARGPGRASGRRWHPPSAFDAFGRPHKARAHCHVHSARAHPDLNQGPAHLRSAALTTELCTRVKLGFRNSIVRIAKVIGAVGFRRGVRGRRAHARTRESVRAGPATWLVPAAAPQHGARLRQVDAVFCANRAAMARAEGRDRPYGLKRSCGMHSPRRDPIMAHGLPRKHARPRRVRTRPKAGD